MSLQNDFWRQFQLFQHISNEDSQFNRFSCGNLESLQKEGISESLHNFHENWYSSNIMNLVLYGNQSMEDLENWAVTHFSGIENKNVTVPDLSEPVMAFDE